MLSKQEIINLVKSPERISEYSLEDLQTLSSDFPYFQGAQVLVSLKLKQTDNLFFDTQIKRTAAQSGDRRKLYEILFQSTIQERISKIDTKIEEEVEAELVEPLDTNNSAQETRFTSPIRFQDLGKKITKLPLVSDEIPKTEINDTNEVEITPHKKPTAQELEGEILLQAMATGYSLELDSESKNLDQQDIGKEKPKQKFGDWLKTLNESKNLSEAEHKKKSVNNLIDNFIKNEPQISKLSAHEDPFSPSSFNKLSLADDDNFVTETLAKIYVKQGNTQKAKKAYEKLMILFPERAHEFRKILDSLSDSEDK